MASARAFVSAPLCETERCDDGGTLQQVSNHALDDRVHGGETVVPPFTHLIIPTCSLFLRKIKVGIAVILYLWAAKRDGEQGRRRNEARRSLVARQHIVEKAFGLTRRAAWHDETVGPNLPSSFWSSTSILRKTDLGCCIGGCRWSSKDNDQR